MVINHDSTLCTSFNLGGVVKNYDFARDEAVIDNNCDFNSPMCKLRIVLKIGEVKVLYNSRVWSRQILYWVNYWLKHAIFLNNYYFSFLDKCIFIVVILCHCIINPGFTRSGPRIWLILKALFCSIS